MIPEGWSEKALGEVCSVVGGHSFPTQWQGRKSGRYPFFKVGDMNSPSNERQLTYAEHHVDDDVAEALRLKVYPPGTVVFPKVGAALLSNKRRYLGVTATFDNNVMGLVAKEIDERFLYHFMETVDFAVLVQHGAVPSVNQTMVADLPIRLPPLPEQKKIADILSSVDDAIEATRAVVEQTKQVKKGLLQKLLTKGIGHTKFKQTPIGEIPEGWELATVGSTIESLKYGTSDKATGTQLDYPVLRIPNICNGRTDLSDLKYIQLDPSQAQPYLIRPNDVLIVRTNGNPELIGRAAIVRDCPREMVYASYLICARTNSRLDARYLNEYLNSDVARFQLLQVTATSAGNYNVNSSQLRNLLIPLPGISEQRQIIDTLEDTNAAIASCEAQLIQATQLKSGLLQDLLTGKTRVAA